MRKIILILLALSMITKSFSQIGIVQYTIDLRDAPFDYVIVKGDGGYTKRLHTGSFELATIPYDLNNPGFISFIQDPYRSDGLQIGSRINQECYEVWEDKNGHRIVVTTTVLDNYYLNEPSVQSLCQGETFHINIEHGAQIQISPRKSQDWKIIPISYLAECDFDLDFVLLERFVNDKFKSSIFAEDGDDSKFGNDCRYKVRAKVGNFYTNEIEIPPYYRQEKFDGSMEINDNNLTIKVNNIDPNKSQNISVSHPASQWSWVAPLSSDHINIELPHCGIYDISIQRDNNSLHNSCPFKRRTNVFEKIYNKVGTETNKKDFWSESQIRNDAIELRSIFYKGDNPGPTIPKSNTGPQKDTSVFKQGEGSQLPTSLKYISYNIINTKPGEKCTLTITYPNKIYIPQTVTYELDNGFPDLQIGNDNIEVAAPQCSDGVGKLVIKQISNGLNCGYKYTINGEKPKDYTLGDEINVQNNDIVSIMDNINDETGIQYRTFQLPQIKLTTVQPTISATTSSATCFGFNGSLIAEMSPNYDNLNYSWTIASTSGNTYSSSGFGAAYELNDLPAANYTLKWSVFKGERLCWDDIYTNCKINQPDAITFTPATRDQSCDESVNGEISFSSTRGGNIGGYQYIISTDESFSNASSTELLTSSSYVFSGVKGSFQKIYYWTKVSDSKQCESSTSQIVVGVNKYVFENVTRNVTCAEASNGVASISLTQNGNGLFEPNIYKWTVSKNSDNRTSSYATIIEDLGQGRHFFTLESHGCALSNTYDIDVNTYKFQNETRDISCEGATNGAATINIIKTGNGIFSSDLYHWTVTKNPDGLTETSTTQLTELPQGRHFLTVDSYGCELTTSVDVNANIYQFALDTAGASCESISNGKAKAIIQKTNNANGFFTPHYHWTYNGITAEYTNLRKDLHCGDYLLEIKWEGGCQLNKPFTIGHKVLKPTIDTVPAPCAIGETPMGRATLTVANATEPIKFSWDMGTPELGLSSVELPAGTHNVSATDKNGCTVLSDFIIRSGNFDVNATITPALCGNKGDGSVAFALSGGSGEYSAIWDDHPELNMPKISGQSYTQENLPLGIYNVTIFDTDGCAYRKEINMSSGNIKISPSHTLASCAGADDATATIAVVNGKGKIEYQWSDGLVSSEPLRLNLKDGVYKVRVTDEDQCSAEAKVNIRSKTPSVDIAVVGASCGLAPDGTAQAEVFAATFPYTYEWSDNKTTSDGFRSQLDKGDYALTVTDNHGCKISNSFHIPHKGYLTNDIPKHITICTNGEAIIDAHEFLDYQWLHNGKEISDERFLSIGDAGVYIIKARGYDDCYAVDTIDVDISQTELDPYFRMSSVSYLEDTLVVVETSEIKPDKFVWLFDQDIFDLVQTDGQEHELRLIPKQPGFFNITLSAAKENCSADITKPVDILSETRPDSLLSPLYVEKSVIERLNVAPNPTEGPFYVDVALKQTADAMLRIYDINYGVVRAQVSLHGSQTYRHQFNENLPSGMYVVILKVGNEQKMAKVMITK